MSNEIPNHSPVTISLDDVVRDDFLKERMEALGETYVSIAAKVAEMRRTESNQSFSEKALRNTIQRAIQNPRKSKLETIDWIIRALDGRLAAKWRTVQTIKKEVETEEEL